MENQTYLSKTLTKDDPSPSESFHSPENLDGFSIVPALTADSLSGSSTFSLVTADSLDLEMENVLEEETVANPRFSESPSNNHVLSFTSRPPSPSSTEPQPSQHLAPIPYDSKKPFDSQEQDQEDPYRWPNSNYNFSYRRRSVVCDQFYSLRENEFKPPGAGYSSWTPRLSSSLSPSEAFRTENEPTGVGAGLENLGNTCYINAVLQCLTHTVPFVLGLRSLNHHCKPCDRDIENFCLLCPLKDHIELSLNSSGGVVLPSKIFDNLNCISSCFQRYQQEDAHEFLQCLFNRLESCCSKSTPKNDSSTSSDDCLVKKVFGGRLVSRLCCCNCGHISYSYECLNDLSLEIENVDTLPSSLASFTKVEKIEAKVRCGNCKEKVSTEKQLMLDQVPLVATFHFKRFKTEGTFVEKIDKHVAFPLELDLQPYTASQTSNEELKYELYAVVKHSGFSPTSGHYICYIRSSPYRWHELNDSMVTNVEDEIVLSQEAYILFYSRQDIPWFSTAVEVPKPRTHCGVSDSSPKSVLDNVECASKPHVESSATADCNSNAKKISTQFSFETEFELELDEPGVAAEGVSGLPLTESEFHVSKSNSSDDNPMNDDSISPGSSNCSDEFEKKSHLGEDNSNQVVDEATNDSSSAWMPSRSQRPCQKDSIGCGPCTCLKDEKRGSHRRGVNGTAMDQGRIEPMRYAKRMPTERGSKVMVLLAPQTGGKIKKRTGSSPRKRVSHRCRHDHNLMCPVAVSR